MTDASNPMTLTTENLGDVPNVDAAGLDDILASDGFGKFAVLSAPDGSFIQAGNAWTPDATCAALLQDHDSDPWVLEYRSGVQQFRTGGRVTLMQVRQAFQSYLAGGLEWRAGFTWTEME